MTEKKIKTKLFIKKSLGYIMNKLMKIEYVVINAGKLCQRI